MTKRIPLTRGYEAIVDNEDYEYLCQWKWHIDPGKNKPYAYAWHDGTTISMSRIVISRMGVNIPKGCVVSYENNNSLDNRRNNLKIVKNGRQVKTHYKNNTSGQIGVYLEKRVNKWRARLRLNRKTIDLGLYKEKEDAIAARKEAERKYWGDGNG